MNLVISSHILFLHSRLLPLLLLEEEKDLKMQKKNDFVDE
jgi:hypothetical protein